MDEQQIDQSPEEGWELLDGLYNIVWFESPQLPEELKLDDEMENDSDRDSDDHISRSLVDEDDCLSTKLQMFIQCSLPTSIFCSFIETFADILPNMFTA